MKSKILIQLDPDAQASSFDRVVAIDAGVEQLFSYSNVQLGQVTSLVHGAIFTRGPQDLSRTAIFVGGSDVAAGEQLLQRVLKSFIGPLRVSVMLDANGANTTAAAAVLAARAHMDLVHCSALVLGGSGPVGQRAARLLAREGARVRLASRSLTRATQIVAGINAIVGGKPIEPCETSDSPTLAAALDDIDLVIAAGAAGVQLLPIHEWKDRSHLRTLIDLNAVPPAGIEGIEVLDKAAQRHHATAYGAIGVGGAKMKIHRAAIAALFESNDKVLDAESIYELGKTLGI